ncbi:MAG: segregation/condensation protein A [Acidobacteriota bacterium]|nr:segregation/condensation protein A [Acidobacteriota bacterium]MDE3106687.1 segregation/condensation protein A [Acidobacteriota bacterium]MDE3223241.1 segregation/condensation protein A [Acidobacteriota bacterium]
MTFVVTTPSFSGPLELLLQMVSAHEIDLVDVPLSPIVDAFVERLRNEATLLDVEELSEFLLIASILLEMKSHQLLPGRDATEPDEEFLGWEERDVMLARLLELRTYASIADQFVSLFQRASRSFPRVRGVNDGFVVRPPDLLVGVTPALVAAAYLRGVEEKPVPVVRLHHVTVDAVTVAETVVSLAQRLPSMGTLSFRRLVADLETRIEVIVHFLALLELCKLGHVTLGQGSTFGDVEISWMIGAEHLELERIDVYEG